MYGEWKSTDHVLSFFVLKINHSLMRLLNFCQQFLCTMCWF